MNLVEQLLKIDANEIEIPKTVKKMYCKKLKREIEFECVAIDAEKANDIQVQVVDLAKGEVNEIDMFKLKSYTIMEGCKSFKDKELMKHFGVPTPRELIKKLLTDGEVTELYNTITELSAYKEAKEDEVKN